MTVIGMTALEEKSRSNGHTYTKVNSAYVRMIERHGALPLILPTFTRLDMAGELISRIDGLLLTGGGDINPRLYGRQETKLVREANDRRDAAEIALTLAAMERELPILGICRGLQILNVAGGGTLRGDVSKSKVVHKVRDYDYSHTHTVSIRPGTRLRELMGKQRVRFNSEHHQAIDRIAPGFVVSALAADGVIEAIEHPEQPFVIGLQSHPEHLPEVFEPILKAFVKAKRKTPLEVALRRLSLDAGRLG